MVYAYGQLYLVAVLVNFLSARSVNFSNERRNCENYEGRKAHVMRSKPSAHPIILLWPNGQIDFRIDQRMPSSHLEVIFKGLEHWEANTCLEFFDRTADVNFNASSDHIYFTGEFIGCYSEIGRYGGKQNLNLGFGCDTMEVVLHEIGHAVGLIHEQSRTDRDDYVKVLRDNVLGNYSNNFLKSVHSKEVQYDYTSIMHYDYNAFSKTMYGANTLLSKDPNYQYLMGSGKRLSFLDKKWINRLYQCSDSCDGGHQKCQNGGFLDQECNCHCPNGVHGDRCDLGTQQQAPVCGGEVHEPLLLVTPAYPSRAELWSNRSCVYQIKAPKDKRVMIRFLDFKLFGKVYGACAMEHMEVRLNGVTTPGTFFCDNELDGRTLFSKHNEMVLLIKSYEGKECYGKGFKAQIDFIDSGQPERQPEISNELPSKSDQEFVGKGDSMLECTEEGISEPVLVTLGQKVTVTSPNFGTRNYKSNELCGTSLKISETENVGFHVEFEVMLIEESEGCQKDSVELLDRHHNIISSFCGTHVPEPQFHNSSQILILFTSDALSSAGGFKVHLTAATSQREDKIIPDNKSKVYCDGNRTIELGHKQSVQIESMNFEENVQLLSDNNQCDVQIKTMAKTSIIKYDITYLHMREIEDCSLSSLRLVAGSSDRMTKFCGNFTFYSNILHEQQVTLQFKHSVQLPQEKFQITFKEIPIS